MRGLFPGEAEAVPDAELIVDVAEEEIVPEDPVAEEAAAEAALLTAVAAAEAEDTSVEDETEVVCWPLAKEAKTVAKRLR